MLEKIDNLKQIEIIPGVASVYRVIHSRPTHGLIFRVGGESLYRFSHAEMLLRDGEMIYIPEGTRFSVRRMSGEQGRYIAVNFKADTAPDLPEKYSQFSSADFNALCSNLLRFQVVDTPSERYRLISLFYDILSRVSKTEKTKYHSSAALKIIEPAADYLKDHIFDTALKVGELHLLCGVSDVYFRKLFISRYGESPKKYLLSRRLDRAKAIIDNGEFNSIKEVAYLSGFEDPLYFSKVFKQKYGVSPSRV